MATLLEVIEEMKSLVLGVGRWHWLMVLCLGVPSTVVLAGCSGKKVPQLAAVHGAVTLDGVPLAGATVTFARQDGGGRSASAVTSDSGEYQLRYLPGYSGAIPGEYNVTIRKTVVTETGKKDAGGFPEQDVRELVPLFYSRGEGKLTATVVAGGEPIDFDLTSAAK